jgi:hypothetical protein
VVSTTVTSLIVATYGAAPGYRWAATEVALRLNRRRSRR